MTTGRRHVLLIEDDDDTREALAAVFELWELEVDAVPEGSEALELARRNSYSAAVVDLSIPEPGAYAVARELKAIIGPPTLIALTGRSDTATQQMALGAGFDFFLTKPANLDHLQQLLTRERTNK